MDLTALQTEYAARGFDYLSTTRQNYHLNFAYNEICEHHPWPFLYTDSTPGAAPVSITDLRQVLSVTDTTNDIVLRGEDRRTLLDLYGDLTNTGNPEAWYLDSATSLKVYPANTSVTLAVRYLKFPTALSAGADIPVVPTRYHLLIVDGAVVQGLKDSDNYDAVAMARAEFDRGLQQMTNTLLVTNYSDPELVIAT